MKNIAEFEKLSKKVTDIFMNAEPLTKYFGYSSEDAILEANDFKKLRDRGGLGDKFARKFMIDNYSKALRHMGLATNEELHKFIDFYDIFSNEDYIIFEMLLCLEDMTYYLQKYGIGIERLKELSEDNDDIDLSEDGSEFAENFSSHKLRMIAEKEMQNVLNYFTNNNNKVMFLASFIYSKTFGQDIIDTLQHHNISEIAFTRRDYIYIVFRNIKIWLSFLSFDRFDRMENIIKVATDRSVKKFSETNPHVVTSKLNGSRITAAGHSIVPGNEFTYNERIFNIKMMTLSEMKNKFNTINELLFNSFMLNQKGKGSYLVIGQDMGVGKSTMLTAMMSEMPNKWGLGILDAQDEIKMGEKFPHMNVITLTGGGEYRTIKECFQIMLKQVRDVLCVSEIVSEEEVIELVNAALRLDSGISGTLHSLSPYEVIPNLRNLLLQTDMYQDRVTAELDLARSLDMLVNMRRLPGGRIVAELYECIVEDSDSYEFDNLRICSEFSLQQKQDKVLDLQQKHLAKQLYNKPYRIVPLVLFDDTINDWIVKNIPSEQYARKISRHVGTLAVDELLDMFKKEVV